MTKLKKEKLVKDMVAIVFEKNTDGYMTIQDIAAITFEGSYTAYTCKALDEQVRRAISGARGIIAENGKNEILIGKKNAKLKGNKVDRWKIASEEDIKDLTSYAKERTNRVNGFIDAHKKMTDNIDEAKLLPEKEGLQLNS